MKSYNGFTPRQRMKAYRWLMAEYAAGRRHQPTRCDACEQTEGLIQPHSEDYSEPFGDNVGRWGLCYRCHMMIHCRFSAPTSFANYVANLAAGRRFPPIHGQQWGTFSRDHLGHSLWIEAQPTTSRSLPGFDALLREGAAVLLRSPGQPPSAIGQLTLPLKPA